MTRANQKLVLAHSNLGRERQFSNESMVGQDEENKMNPTIDLNVIGTKSS